MSNGNGGAAANENSASARDRARRTVEELGENPMALLAGGLALGALVGMLLPRAARERELLDPVGRKFAARAGAVAQAAKEAGRQEIESLLPGRDAAKERVSTLFGNVVNAAKEAAKS